MKFSLTINLLAILLGFVSGPAQGEEFDFYQRFSSLIDTNRWGPPLTNATLRLESLRKGEGLAGVNLGTSMSDAVQLWGKPRSLFSSCGGGPQLAFGNGSLGFRGDKVVRITICPKDIPGLQFEGGLNATNTPAQFANALGLAAPSSAELYLTLKSEKAALTWQWCDYTVGGRKLLWLTIESTEVSTRP
jgi:hypothetical protein